MRRRTVRLQNKGIVKINENLHTAPNTAYTLRANALTLRDTPPFGRNGVYPYSLNAIGDNNSVSEKNEYITEDFKMHSTVRSGTEPVDFRLK